MTDTDSAWMARALELARQAACDGEVPVGALIVRDDELIANGRNHPIAGDDATAHAEIAALRGAGAALGNYRLPDCTLYVTLEPCMMCVGAIVHARINRLVFGADDPRAGAVHSIGRFLDQSWLNHKMAWQSGVLAGDCSEILRAFFRERR